ncbi:hypothetical protein ACSOS3_41855 [Streptomyces hygroscopicus]
MESQEDKYNGKKKTLTIRTTCESKILINENINFSKVFIRLFVVQKVYGILAHFDGTAQKE